jgi:hypothetical protein
MVAYQYFNERTETVPLCGCGCGQETKLKQSRFCQGHSMRVPGIKLNHPRYVPTTDEIPSGLCECGCGGKTHVVNWTIRGRRWFKGHPAPFLSGHANRKSGVDHHLFVGRRKTASGYIYVYAPDHPNARRAKEYEGYVLEHRLLWERANGRLLRRDEHVHHINGVRDDNRLENLVALTSSQHMALTQVGRPLASAETRRKLSDRAKTQWAEVRSQGRINLLKPS